MREILFRGKRKDNGEYKKGDWVFGDLVRLKDGEKTLTMIYGFGEVDAETVGQYTGLTDKNGTKIFEGDIIQTCRKGLRGEKTFKYVIKYGTYIPLEYCKDAYLQFETIGFYAFDGERSFQLGNYLQMLEVIGNIHDNPELLGGGEL